MGKSVPGKGKSRYKGLDVKRALCVWGAGRKAVWPEVEKMKVMAQEEADPAGPCGPWGRVWDLF